MSVDSGKKPDLLAHLLQLSGVINSDLHLNSVLRRIIEAAMDITGSEAASVFLLDTNRKNLILTMPAGPAEEAVSGVTFPKTEGLAGWVATNGKAQIVNDVTKDDRFRGDFQPEIFATRNLMCVPLFDQTNSIIGVLQTVNKKGSSDYHEDEIPVFQALANQAAVALGNAKLNEDREKLLGEIHHRVKNNMAVISAFMQIEAMGEQDDNFRLKLLKNVSRITGMSVVHEQLYKSESLTDVGFVENVRQIISKTVETLETDAEFEVETKSELILLNINQAIPCSLLLVEIIMHIITTNSDKSLPKFIQVVMNENEKDNFVELIISYSEEKKNNEPAVLSHQLTKMLASQCSASLSYEHKDDNPAIRLVLKKTAMRGSGNYAL